MARPISIPESRNGRSRHLERSSIPRTPYHHKGRADAYAILGRYDEALAELASYENLISDEEAQWRSPHLIHFTKAFLLSRLGRYREAETVLQKGIERARELEQLETEAGSHLLAAWLALEQENYPQAREHVSRSERLFPRISDEVGPFNMPNQRTGFTVLGHLLGGIAEARSENLEGAHAHLDAQTNLYDASDVIEKWHHHALKGEIALIEGDETGAELAFSTGEPELKMWFNQYFPGPSVLANSTPSRDGLARAKKAQGDLRGAIKIYRDLNTPGMSSKWTAWFEPRYVLETARLLDEIGDKDSARAEYERFLEYWKDADPDLPELQEAKKYVGR